MALFRGGGGRDGSRERSRHCSLSDPRPDPKITRILLTPRTTTIAILTASRRLT